MANNIEYRIAQLRAATAAFEVAGRAASYGKPSQDLGGFVEYLLPGCFTRSLANKEYDVKCLVNHDANQVLGRQANKTLTLTDSFDGLDFVCKLNKDSQAHRDLYASVKRGDLSECSFAFIVDGEDGQSFSSPDKNGLLTRTIKRAKLLDCSVVCTPAYGNGATNVAARAAAAQHSGNDQTAIRAQIARFNGAHGIIDRRHGVLCVKDPQMDYATIKRAVAENWSEDRLNKEYMKELSKRGAGDAYSWVDSATPEQIRNFAITRQVADEFGVDMRDLTFGDGGGVAANSPRYQQGQANDPECQLRDDDFDDGDFWDDDDKKDDDWNSDRHLRCRDFHRNQAQYAKSMNRCAACHNAANLHETAAQTRNSADSRAARQASKRLLTDVSQVS
jgi:uncharacterized protein